MSESTSSENPNRSFYDRISKAYDFITDSNEHVAREKGQNALALKSGESVLEIGFGPGRGLVDFANQVGESGKVCGLDISEGMVKVAQERLEKEHLASRAELTVGDGRHLPYGDDSFDAVFMSFTLELFDLTDIPTVLQQCKRVLRSGGRLGVVTMFAKDGAHGLQDLYKWLHRHFPHAIDCQPIQADKFIEEAGFKINSREEMNIWSLPVLILVAEAS
jgi:ubiquinone/menaquinone biosynthesis C-methylase UbiE